MSDLRNTLAIELERCGLALITISRSLSADEVTPIEAIARANGVSLRFFMALFKMNEDAAERTERAERNVPRPVPGAMTLPMSSRRRLGRRLR